MVHARCALAGAARAATTCRTFLNSTVRELQIYGGTVHAALQRIAEVKIVRMVEFTADLNPPLAGPDESVCGLALRAKLRIERTSAEPR
ncbi:MAG: hypothetical protein U1E52_02910 [Geminicoccaceae bacterium]